MDSLDRLRAALSDRYTVERELGRGGTATVYLATDLRHDRPVALKVLRPELASVLGPERFLREIRTTARLTHPHILPLLDSGDVDGTLFFVMPYVAGESLRERLEKEKQLPLEEALRIAREVADALSYAHAQGVIHRDIKPENILLESGHAVVTDFGIARAIDVAGGERLTETGIAVGTPTYMSPEQASGSRELDARSDLYSLGCMLYEMLAGDPPFVASDSRVLLARHLMDPVPPLRTVRAVPSGVASAIDKALNKAPADRFGSAGALRDALLHTESEPRERGSSIAVLPFANLSPDPDDEYLSDGISEEIIVSLGTVPGLRVIARTSAFAFKGMNLDVREIGARLGVNRVLEGSVRRSGERIRITAQLLRAEDGGHVWSERFDRSSDDVFAIQDEIAASITRRLSMAEGAAVQVRQPGGTDDRAAYDLYLRGRYYANQATDEWSRKAAECFQQSFALDPSFAQAYAAHAGAQVVLCTGPGVLQSKEAIPGARDAASRAVALAPDLADGHMWLGVIATHHDWDRQAARHRFDVALSLSPNSPEVLTWYAWYLTWLEGSYEEAIGVYERARESNPLDLSVRALEAYSRHAAGDLEGALAGFQEILAAREDFALAHYCSGEILGHLGRSDEAFEAFERGFELGGRAIYAVGALAWVYGSVGRVADAERVIAELEDRVAQGQGSELAIAWGWAGLGNRDRMYEWFERGIRERDPKMLYLSSAHQVDKYRSEPRFRALLERMGLGHFNPGGG
jgi:serine/threonine-protein kinase